MQQSHCRLLVIKPSSLGDIIQTLQVVEGAYHVLKEKGIFLEIHWIVRDCFYDLLALSPIIKRSFIFKRYGGIRAFIQLMREVRLHDYDYILDFQGLLRSGLMTFFAKGACKIGRMDAREGASWFYQKRCFPQTQDPHAVEILKSLFNIFDIDATPQRPLTFSSVPLPEILSEKPYVAIFPSSRAAVKEWPHFLEYARNILEQTKMFCLWLDQNKSSHAAHFQHDRFIDLAGKTSLGALPTLIQNAQCVVANDSGPLHLAAALCKTLVGLYGPTDYKRYGPYPIDDPQHGIFQAPRGGLAQVTVQSVVKTTLRILKL
ncbi:MAG: glycosyltransferase family 9 protein [Puniceicoccales bacterium]|jgi:ADP-heptose:LPS heptosyltransferase|nr:glycosyltransferase family 9 protein [Puniceicoccales bacterium]